MTTRRWHAASFDVRLRYGDRRLADGSDHGAARRDRAETAIGNAPRQARSPAECHRGGHRSRPVLDDRPQGRNAVPRLGRG